MPRTLEGCRLVAGFLRSRALGRPFILSHLLTGRCNARCPTCMWRRPQESSTERPGTENALQASGTASGTASAVAPAGELRTEEVEKLYRQAARAGLVQLVVWGGEPTLRRDLPRLLWTAKEAGLLVTLITNGHLLGRRWPELRGAVDTLILSVDDLGEAHDLLRGIPGLFERLEELVGRLAGDPLKPRLLLNTVLSGANPGALERVAPLAKRWGAGLYFCPMETGQMQSGGFDERLAELALAPDELRGAAYSALRLKALGYPLLSTQSYLRLLQRDPELTQYTCRVPRAILTIEADGSVRDCLRRDRPLASFAQIADGLGLEALYRSPRYRAMAREAEACTACNNPDVVETSWLWDLRPSMLRKVLGLASL